jgi:LCP family protein required for cell wall assembly
LILVYPIWFLYYANGKLHRVDASVYSHSASLSASGTTYLIAGSDRRVKGYGPQDFENAGARSDAIMVLHKASNGFVSLMSIPRDTYVKIPNNNSNKINASFSIGGPKLLEQTIEDLTGMKVDHYVEINFKGLIKLVNAIGGINLCYDRNVNDAKSGMKWKKGCHDITGSEALSFSRMRYSDPNGDIGRQERQQQVINAIVKKAMSFDSFVWPPKQFTLLKGISNGIFIDKKDNIIDLLFFVLALKDVKAKGTPTIKSESYYVSGAGSCVILDKTKSKKDYQDIINGNWKPPENK